LHSHDRVIHTRLILYFHRNAVRTDAGEDWTVSHTVPLRSGDPQKHAIAYWFWHKIFLLDSRGRVAADIQTRTAMNHIHVQVVVYVTNSTPVVD